MKVIIDPRSDILYSSFYIHGLIDLFGERNITFSMKPFNTLSISRKNGFPNFNFILYSAGEPDIKYSIQTNDTWKINDELYDWCNVYGHVNANFIETPQEQYPKLVSLAPSFGISFLSEYKTIKYSFLNLLKIKDIDYLYNKSFFKALITHFGSYKRCLQRCKISDYQLKFSSDRDYIFHLSTLWYNDIWNKNDEELNQSRANFIRACKSISDIQFEGGFVGDDRSSKQKFRDCLFEDHQGRVSLKTWIENTKKSLIVFNTPAFWNCHGWKLGEYLAMGKAIISTPLFNDLPAPLIHGKHIHIVENDEQKIKEAILYIIQNDEYRKKLEQGSREWWDQYGTPIKSLELLGIKN